MNEPLAIRNDHGAGYYASRIEHDLSRTQNNTYYFLGYDLEEAREEARVAGLGTPSLLSEEELDSLRWE